MHATARAGLFKLLGGAGVLVLAVVLVLLLVRGCRSEEERVADAVDDARDALVDRRAEEFLAFFSPEVTYRGKGTRKTLERDLARWNEFRVGRVMILEKQIVVEGRKARIHLRCDVGAILRDGVQVGVDLVAEKQGEAWVVTSFDWRYE